METLFENRYTVNLRMLRSFSRGASFSQKFFFRFSLVGMAVCALALVYCLLFLPGDYNAMVSPAVSFLLCLMLFFFPSLTAQIVYRNTKKLHGGIVPETVVQFSNDEISMTEGTLSVRFQYRQITKIRGNREFVCADAGKEQWGLSLEKNCFTIGNFGRRFALFLPENMSQTKKIAIHSQHNKYKRCAFLYKAAPFLQAIPEAFGHNFDVSSILKKQNDTTIKHPPAVSIQKTPFFISFLIVFLLAVICTKLYTIYNVCHIMRTFLPLCLFGGGSSV